MRLAHLVGKERRLLLLLALLSLVVVPVATQAETTASADAYGFGAAFAFSQQVAGLTFAAAGTIGNADAWANAGGFGWSYVSIWSEGLASANAVAFDTGFSEFAKVQVIAVGGLAEALAQTGP